MPVTQGEQRLPSGTINSSDVQIVNRIPFSPPLTRSLQFIFGLSTHTPLRHHTTQPRPAVSHQSISMTPSLQFLSILLLALTPFSNASHARGGHLTNAQAFAAGVLDGFKALPLPPPSFISTTFENSPGQLRMVPSGKKGKRHGHGGQAVLSKSCVLPLFEIFAALTPCCSV